MRIDAVALLNKFYTKQQGGTEIRIYTMEDWWKMINNNL